MIAADRKRDHEPVPRIVEIEQREVAGEGLLDLARHRAELPERIVLQHQRDAEGGEDGGQVMAAEQRAQNRHVNGRPEQRDDRVATRSAIQKSPVAAKVITPT